MTQLLNNLMEVPHRTSRLSSDDFEITIPSPILEPQHLRPKSSSVHTSRAPFESVVNEEEFKHSILPSHQNKSEKEDAEFKQFF